MFCRRLTRLRAVRKLSNRGAQFLNRRYNDSFLNGSNAAYADYMYDQWTKDPESVHSSWQAYFATGGFDTPDPSKAYSPGIRSSGEDGMKVASLHELLNAYQTAGHFVADIDPLGLTKGGRKGFSPATLTLEHWGFSEKDLDTPVPYDTKATSTKVNMFAQLRDENGCVTPRQLIDHCKKTYCGSIGYEYMHIADQEKCDFMRQNIEVAPEVIDNKTKKFILKELATAKLFEDFLNLKYPAQKRFGLDGVESLMISMKALVNESSDLGVDDFVIGMPHRGRLNVLANVVRKPLKQIFHEFSGQALPPEDVGGSGDVKYHLGASHDRLAGRGNDKLVHLSLVANPSHLETCNPVVLGKTRAKMTYKGDLEGDRTMALLLHGDAAFAGQGLVYECMGFADLPDYHTGGTIHIVVNNQIGFTTDPFFARSSPYCTSLTRAFASPILHVNGDDPEAVFKVSNLAAKFRQKFKCDVVIDLVGYRKHGHNEGDEPRFTHPLMYSIIDKLEDSYRVYAKKLIAEGVIDQAYLKGMEADVTSRIADSFEAARQIKTQEANHRQEIGNDWLDSRWEGFKSTKDLGTVIPTGITEEDWAATLGSLQNSPKDFNLHRRLKKAVIDPRIKSLETGEGLDWGAAEMLAFGSLLREGCHVRLSGQDSERGTFSHRHAVLHEQKNMTKEHRPQYRPLEHIEGSQAKFTVCNSPLNEYGVLGFDLGYSIESPHALVLWEAQFGDFANGAQVMFDTYLSAGESKWVRMSGLTCLLPHGYEGGGPEHSSCRIERYLQMVDDNPTVFSEIDSGTQIQVQATNWQVMNLSTPAQVFHALRRQIHRNFRKPLILATPKSLLKLRMCTSKKEEFLGDTRFHRVLEDDGSTLTSNENVQRILLCSGKIYYELFQERERLGLNNVAITRVEQIAPFPFDKIKDEIKRFPNAEIYWVQEEPMNMGCWTYVEPRIRTVLQTVGDVRQSPGYIGRNASAAPATGYSQMHKKQIMQVLEDAFDGIQ